MGGRGRPPRPALGREPMGAAGGARLREQVNSGAGGARAGVGVRGRDRIGIFGRGDAAGCGLWAARDGTGRVGSGQVRPGQPPAFARGLGVAALPELPVSLCVYAYICVFSYRCVLYKKMYIFPCLLVYVRVLKCLYTYFSWAVAAYPDFDLEAPPARLQRQPDFLICVQKGTWETRASEHLHGSSSGLLQNLCLAGSGLSWGFFPLFFSVYCRCLGPGWPCSPGEQPSPAVPPCPTGQDTNSAQSGCPWVSPKCHLQSLLALMPSAVLGPM